MSRSERIVQWGRCRGGWGGVYLRTHWLFKERRSIVQPVTADVRSESRWQMQIGSLFLTEAADWSVFTASVTTMLPLTPPHPQPHTHSNLLPPLPPPLLLLPSAQSQNLPLISTMRSVAGVSRRSFANFIYLFIFFLPLAS